MRLGRKQPQPDEEGYFETGLDAADVSGDEMQRVTIRGIEALVTRVGDRLYAFSDVCPHAAADLGEGRVFQGQVKCPDHGYTFDVRTGRASWPPGEGCHLTRYDVKVEAGQVKLRVE